MFTTEKNTLHKTLTLKAKCYFLMLVKLKLLTLNFYYNKYFIIKCNIY